MRIGAGIGVKVWAYQEFVFTALLRFRQTWVLPTMNGDQKQRTVAHPCHLVHLTGRGRRTKIKNMIGIGDSFVYETKLLCDVILRHK